MQIVALSDIHNVDVSGEEVETAISAADLVIISGDITTFGGRSRAEAILDGLKALNNSIYGIIGNCDTSPVGVVLDEYGFSVGGKSIEHQGVYIAGVHGVEQRRFHGRFFSELTQATENIPIDAPLILVSHQPCSGTIIANRAGYDGGSCGLRKFITKRKPMLALSGHIHESYGQDMVGSSVLINPGSYAEGRYAVIDADIETQTITAVEFRTCNGAKLT